MEKYIGTKTISAEVESKDGKDGYKVEYDDSYVSWSPKEVFEKSYTLIDDNNKKSREIICDCLKKANKKEGIFVSQSYVWTLLNILEEEGVTFLNINSK